MRILIAMVCSLLPLVAHAAVTVEKTRVGHGVSAWYVESDAVPVVHVVLSFEGAGSVSDPTGKAGRAALAAAMLNEGAGPYSSVHFQQALEDKAIEMSADASDDRLTIHIHALREQAVEAGKLVALALSQPHFAPNDLARVKDQTRSLLARLEETPNYRAARRLQEVAFEGHPYASPHYGTAQRIAAITEQDLHDYIKTYVARQNLLVTAAGDVDSSLLDDMLRPITNALGTSDAGNQPVSRVGMQGAGSEVRVGMKVPQTVVLFAAPAIARDDPRFYAYYLMNEILGANGLTARLGEAVRQKKGLVYGINTGIDERSGASLLLGRMATRNERAEEAIATVKNTLEEFALRGASAQECEDARAHVIGGFPLQLDSTRDSAGVLMMMRIHQLGDDYLTERVEKFRAVRCGDINALAAELLRPGRFLFVTAGAP